MAKKESYILFVLAVLLISLVVIAINRPFNLSVPVVNLTLDAPPEEFTNVDQARWDAMGELITDEILNTFAVVSEDIAQVPSLIKERYGGLADTWMCTVETGDSDLQKQLVAAVQAAFNQWRTESGRSLGHISKTLACSVGD